jgi:transposase
MRELEKQSEEKLRDDLIARVTRLEERLESQRVQYESRIEHERVTHAADLALIRHRMNNLDQCLTMILALIEANPAEANKAAARVREMRKAQELSEATEKGAIHAAKIASAPAPNSIPGE